MRGVGESHGAITFVNALPTGVGAAGAIGRGARAEVELTPTPGGTVATSPEMTVGERTPLVQASFASALAVYANGEPYSGRLALASAIQPSVGLKSSSAVSVAILRAVARALGRTTDDVEVARRSADLSQGIGLSATGAFDDALACAAGGVAITDNRSRAVLRQSNLPSSLDAVLWIPPGTHAVSPRWKAAFEARAAEGQAAVDAALAGDLFEAMERNTLLVESVMGYDYAAVRRRLKDAGALGCSVSGLGPALACILPRERVEDARSVLADAPGTTLSARLTGLGEPTGGRE